MEANGLKNQTVGLLQAVSYLKGKLSPIIIYYLESVCILLFSILFYLVPLIAVDALVIVVELLFGGWNLCSC